VLRRLATVAALATAFACAAAGSAAAIDMSRLMAPPSACPGQHLLGAPASVQERAMRCMTNFARRRAHRRQLERSRALDRSAGLKSRDIVRCDSFSHFACGRDFTFWIRRVGYLPSGCWRAGENIAWGTGSKSSVRSIFGAWMRSPGHRRNILSNDYEHIGIGLEIGSLEGFGRAHVWTQHFGQRC
jgi:uncharacterized protein YkwD